MKPTWDEYFISIAKLVASRSSCSSRKVGSVIVKDKMIVSSGYNGTPRGIKNCNEGGCSRCEEKRTGKIKIIEGLLSEGVTDVDIIVERTGASKNTVKIVKYKYNKKMR